MSQETNPWTKWCEGALIPSGIVEVEFVNGTTCIDNAGVFNWTAIEIWKWRFAQDSDEMPAPAGKPPGSGLHGRCPESSPSLHDVLVADAALEEFAAQLEVPASEANHAKLLDKYFGVQDTLAQRGKRYGDFAENAKTSQRLQEVVRSCEGYARLNATQREALGVICQKMARILNGDPNYKDNWHDIQGYARLAEERCRGQEP